MGWGGRDRSAQRALLPESVELVDEDDARRRRRRLFEERAHPCGAATDEELDKVRSGTVKERHLRLRRHHASEERLARAGRPDQQHSRRQPGARGAKRSGSRSIDASSSTSAFAPSIPAMSSR